MARLTVSIDDHLAEAFDVWIAQRGYANRSEAFRDFVRAEMDRNRLAAQPEFSGKTIVVILPDSDKRYLSTTLFSV